LLDLKSFKQDLEFHARLGQSAASGSDQAALHVSAGASAPRQTADVRGPVTSLSEAVSLEFKRHRTGFAVSLVVILAVLAGGAFGLYKLLNRSHLTHFQSSTIARITNSGKVIDARLSRDGTYLVYALSDAGKQGLWIRTVSAANDKEIV